MVLVAIILLMQRLVMLLQIQARYYKLQTLQLNHLPSFGVCPSGIQVSPKAFIVLIVLAILPKCLM